MRDPEEIIGWFCVALLCVLIACLGVGAVYLFVDGIQTSRAKDRCGELGGKVDHYDEHHATLWRCVGAPQEQR